MCGGNPGGGAPIKGCEGGGMEPMDDMEVLMA